MRLLRAVGTRASFIRRSLRLASPSLQVGLRGGNSTLIARFELRELCGALPQLLFLGVLLGAQLERGQDGAHRRRLLVDGRVVAPQRERLLRFDGEELDPLCQRGKGPWGA